MDEVKLLRNKQINDFMASFDDLNNVTTDEIKEGLKKILQETPAVDFEYGVDYQLNEATGDEDRIQGLKKIHILYSYFDDDEMKPKIGRISYVVG